MTMDLIMLADAWSMHDSDVGVGWMVLMLLGMALFWGLVVLGVVWLIRGAVHHRADDPISLLNRRLAEGLLSTEEYQQRRKLIDN